jgi:OOP family OmpA-OmpF porin
MTMPTMPTGLYLGAGGGTGTFEGTCSGAPSCKDSDTTWKVFGGYNFTSIFGIEASYQDLGKFNASANTTPASSLNGSVTGFEISGTARWAFTPQFSVGGKLGWFGFDRKASGNGPQFTNVANDTGGKPIYGVNGSYAFTRNWVGRLEWQQIQHVAINNGDHKTWTASLLYQF